MTKIKNTEAYPLKIPVATDTIVGSDSENDGKTVSFQFDSFVDFINSVNGSEIISYTFATSPVPDLDENGDGFFLSKDNVVEPGTITELKFSKKTKSGIDITLFFNFIDTHKNTFTVHLRNLSNPNNFVYLNILEITEDDFQFLIQVSAYASDVYLGNLIDKNIYVLEFNIKADTDVLGKTLDGLDTSISGPITMSYTVIQAFGSLQNQYNQINTVVSGKLDKGSYSGTAENLKAEIDNIYQPNTLISSVSPTRSVNTFTFPANQYTVLINKTIRTNPAQFVTTIDVATTDYKRVDLIWFKNDNTLQKTVGTESITVAQRPDIPTGQIGVPISFINVFGNVINDPTPITPEISFQDVFGTERFRGDYVRIDGVSFSPAQKLISINPLVPLSAFLDIVNGDDVTATIENSKKPFKTIEKLISSLPVTNGETYTIYITGGVVPVLRKLPIRNLTFVAYTDTTLDFTNCKENNGTTEATEVLSGTPTAIGMWTFQNQNISIICNYVGVKNFILNDQTPATRNSIIFRGTINVLDWKSTGPTSISGFAVRGESDFIVKNFYDSSQNRVNLFPILGTTILTINNLITSRRNQVAVVGTSINIDIKNITQAVSNSTTLLVGGNNIRIGNVNITGIIAPRCIGQLELYGTFSSTTTIDFLEVPVITGTLLSTTYSTNSNLANTQTFRNFTGKLNGLITVGGTVVLDNANIQVDTYLIEKFVARQDVLTVRGFTTIVQNNTSVDLFRKFPSSTITDLNVVINIEGKLNSNVKSYGKNTSYTNTTYTFKEKINEVIIRSKIDIINKVLNPSNTYVIDGVITLLSGEFIDVPAGGITIAGYGFDVSQINKNVSGESIFRSPAGNSGNIVTRDIQYNSGAGSVFNLTDSDGSHAIEFNDVNFVSCSSLGTFNGYRQFTGTTCGFYNLLDGLTLGGNWSGFKLTNSNIIGFGSSGTFFKDGGSLLFGNRFYIDLNIQVSTGSKICNFSDTNFTNDKSLQVVNCYTKVNGVVNDGLTNVLFPNITPYSAKSYFLNNIGIKNSNNMPYGISTSNMQTYANDTDAAAGGIVQVGDTYIETSTGYFKKRLT